MATRMAVRYMSHRFSSGKKILSEEEMAAENIYIKKWDTLMLSSFALEQHFHTAKQDPSHELYKIGDVVSSMKDLIDFCGEHKVVGAFCKFLF